MRSRLNKKCNYFKKIASLKKIFSEWQELNLYDPNLMNILNDAMINQIPIELNYEGSGTRDVIPYAFTQTKDGNILLNVYKDTGEIRRYRFDRINNIWIDNTDQYEEESYEQNNNEQNNNEQEFMEEDYDNMYNEQYDEEYNEEIPMYDDPELNNSNQQQISQEEPIYDEQIFDQNQESEEFTDEV